MSYNIDSMDMLVCKAWMSVSDITDLLRDYEGELPEDCFLSDLRERVDDSNSVKPKCKCGNLNAKNSKFCNACGKKLPKSKAPDRVQLTSINWRCEGSGHSWYDVFLPIVAPRIHGEVQAIVYWEGGDSVTGIAVKDGKVLETEVVQTLKLPKSW